MIYRDFRNGDIKVSLLGLGGMRFPTDSNGQLDEAKAIELIRTAIDGGINYVDTAYTYHGGLSEEVIGKALKNGYRDKTLVADKMPTWLIKNESDVRRILEEQFARLDVDHIDMYLVHSVSKDSWKTTCDCNVLKVLQEYRDNGKIGYIGFSFHDEYPVFENVIDAYDWDFCQIQLNYVDVDFQAGLRGLRYAASKGVPVVIMEPLKGGRITDFVPDAIKEIWDSSTVKRTPADRAFRWVARFPEVLTVLSGISSMEQLEENLEIFSDEDMGRMSEEELTMIEKAAALYRRLIKYQCTTCGYCVPCPQGLPIPRIIRYLNDWYAFEKNPKEKNEYLTWLDKSERASNCVKCGQCEKACPQHLPIMDIMDEVANSFGE